MAAVVWRVSNRHHPYVASPSGPYEQRTFSFFFFLSPFFPLGFRREFFPHALPTVPIPFSRARPLQWQCTIGGATDDSPYNRRHKIAYRFYVSPLRSFRFTPGSGRIDISPDRSASGAGPREPVHHDVRRPDVNADVRRLRPALRGAHLALSMGNVPVVCHYRYLPTAFDRTVFTSSFNRPARPVRLKETVNSKSVRSTCTFSYYQAKKNTVISRLCRSRFKITAIGVSRSSIDVFCNRYLLNMHFATSTCYLLRIVIFFFTLHIELYQRLFTNSLSIRNSRNFRLPFV